MELWIWLIVVLLYSLILICISDDTRIFFTEQNTYRTVFNSTG